MVPYSFTGHSQNICHALATALPTGECKAIGRGTIPDRAHRLAEDQSHTNTHDDNAGKMNKVVKRACVK